MAERLANVLLDEVDKALEARGYNFARYADDCNVYVGTCWVGRRTSDWRKHPKSGESWTRVDAPPPESHPAQALEKAEGHLP